MLLPDYQKMKKNPDEEAPGYTPIGDEEARAQAIAKLKQDVMTGGGPSAAKAETMAAAPTIPMKRIQATGSANPIHLLEALKAAQGKKV